jgi:hypothetical protein
VYETTDGTIENECRAGALKLQPPAPAFAAFRYISRTRLAAPTALARADGLHLPGTGCAKPGTRPATMHTAYGQENREETGEYVRRQGIVFWLAIVHGSRFHLRLICLVVFCPARRVLRLPAKTRYLKMRIKSGDIPMHITKVNVVFQM